MLPVFRFLQLLCENHNRDLQNFLRAQSNKNSKRRLGIYYLNVLDILVDWARLL
jgi:hypothetical protein